MRIVPVAFEASAEDRDRRALTSIMQYSSLVGFRAYWMLHSPTIFKARITLRAVSRNMKYSLFHPIDKGYLV